jgi:hypothetical protein
VLLAMGKPVAGKLLQILRVRGAAGDHQAGAEACGRIKPQELLELVNEFEELFSEGTGLMDNAKAMEGILEEGLTPDEVDGLLGRRTQFESLSRRSVWDRVQDLDPGAGRHVPCNTSIRKPPPISYPCCPRAVCRQDPDDTARSRPASTSCAGPST